MQWKGNPLGQPTPAIVSRAIWKRTQKTVNRHRSFSGTMADLKHFRLQGGMIQCGCGQTMTTQKVCNNKRTKKHYTYYFCMGWRQDRNDCREPRIRLEIVERLAWEKVVALVRDPATLRKAIEHARGSEN